MVKNVERRGVQIDRWNVVADFKDKLLVRSALYKNSSPGEGL